MVVQLEVCFLVPFHVSGTIQLVFAHEMSVQSMCVKSCLWGFKGGVCSPFSAGPVPECPGLQSLRAGQNHKVGRAWTSESAHGGCLLTTGTWVGLFQGWEVNLTSPSYWGIWGLSQDLKSLCKVASGIWLLLSTLMGETCVGYFI